MAWITTIDEKDAEGDLKQIYQSLIKERGKISNILKVHSLLPEAMQAHLELYLSIMFNKSTIKREDKELLAVIVSSLNHCEYCIQHHSDALFYYWKDNEKIQDIILKREKSQYLNDSQKAMVNYAVKLTNNASSILQDDITLLKNAGFTDKAILEIVLITSYFNFVNRVALGLGVEFNPEELKGYKY